VTKVSRAAHISGQPGWYICRPETPCSATDFTEPLGAIAQREARVRKRIFEIPNAMEAASHAEVLGGRKGRKTRHASS